jgi:DNA ligase (NAD+)
MDVKELVSNLIKYDYYYTIGEPLISDKEYDDLRDKLYEIDPKNKYFKRVGCEDNNCEKLKYWLGSQTKIKNEKNLNNWIKKYNSNNYIISEKLDGISGLFLNKENKLFTRGNGSKGRDISHIIKYINMPTFNNNKIIAVRGELIIKKNKWKNEYGSNARNVVAGLVNNKIINKKLLNLVDFIIYQIIEIEDNENIKIEDQLNMINNNKIKFIKTDNIEFNNLKNILIDFKENSEYEIDGIIITDNSKSYSNNIEGNPEHSFAFKLNELDKSKITIVKDVEYNLSKDNRFKPTVLFETINLDQVNISKASGYNLKFIIDNGIGIGSKIEIIRSGQVIPKIINVIEKTEPKLPTLNWIWDDTNTDAIFVKNINDESPEEQKIKISTHFFKTLDIKNISEKTIKKLYDNGFKSLNNILEINSKEDLLNIEGFGDKKIEIIINAIQASKKHNKLEEIMAASNIFERSLGVKKLKLILDSYPNIINENITNEQLIKINGIGDINAKHFNNSIDNFKKFYFKYFNIIEKNENENKNKNENENELNLIDKRLVKKIIVFSGIRDKKMEKLIIDNGGKINGSVSKKTEILIVKDLESNSNSIKKAKELNITIIKYDDIKIN